MSEDTTADMRPGGYRYIPSVVQYSAGVAALAGFQIERVRFLQPVPLQQGFDRIARMLKAAGRPLAALCACELRSPKPFTETGFKSFNDNYIEVLRRWGIATDGITPVARSNVCPAVAPPQEPSFHAFSYTRKAEPDAPASFIISGSGEAPEGKESYRDHIICKGDVSPAGLQAKAAWVIREMERRMSAFGAGWQEVTGAQLYTVHNVFAQLGGSFTHCVLSSHGLNWHLARPPIVDLEYEMDCRRVSTERVEYL